MSVCRLRTIVSDFFSQEIIQNADDAGATAVHFYLDSRRHGTDYLVEPKLATFQGPSLLAYNDAVFTDDDWQSIQDLQQSVKTKDPFKVGKFGIGFNSVYHITGMYNCSINYIAYSCIHHTSPIMNAICYAIHGMWTMVEWSLFCTPHKVVKEPVEQCVCGGL